MINRYVEVTDEYVKQLEHEIDNLKAINEEHKKINGKLREEYNKIQNLYESVFAESKKQKEVIDEIEKILNSVGEMACYSKSMYLDERLRKDLSPDIYCLVHNKIVSLKQQCKKQKEVIDRTINAIDLVIELIKQQPMEDDIWILARLNGFKIILEDKEM